MRSAQYRRLVRLVAAPTRAHTGGREVDGVRPQTGGRPACGPYRRRRSGAGGGGRLGRTHGTDYQDEVAAAALIECLQRNYDIRGVDIGLSFDRERNRYEFTWDGVPAELGPQ
jgi:hypothetical protein